MTTAKSSSRDRSIDHADRRCGRGHEGRGRYLHGCLGIDGRAGRSLGRAPTGSDAVSVNKAAMANAKPTAIFMHCLPAFHDLKTKIGKEVYEKIRLQRA